MSQVGKPKFASALEAWPIDVAVLPVCCSNNDETLFCPWAAPAMAFAKKVLDNGDHHVAPKIRDFWFSRHQLIHHKDCAPLPLKNVLQNHKPSACWVAGVCFCSKYGKELQAFTKAFAASLRKPLAKHSPFRLAYDEGCAMVELHIAAVSRSWFFHLSYLNLTTKMGAIMEMVIDSDTIRVQVAEVKEMMAF